MDSTAAGLDFAVIGHQDSWHTIEKFVNGLRAEDQEKLSREKIKNIFSFIPPRDVFRVTVKSQMGREINGVYIETFIDPDKLDSRFSRANINKVVKAISQAKQMGAKIVTLGGFTSIVLKGKLASFSQSETKFTTGNTLTAAYIVKAVEAASKIHSLNLSDSSILIVGATGDIGTACARYFKNKTRRLLLSARNQVRLEELSRSLEKENVDVRCSVEIEKLTPLADVIICVASSSEIKFFACKRNVLICDAGYPKNVEARLENDLNTIIFHGGMGQVTQGYRISPDYSSHIYRYAAPFVIHGCILEAMVLAFENKYESYSCGKGNISVDKMDEIYNLSLNHGIKVAPFYNSKGLW